MPPIQIGCSGCVCYAPIEKTLGQGGECHRFPPTVVVVRKVDTFTGQQGDGFNTMYPHTRHDSWCAEFRPVPVEPQASNDAEVKEV